MLAYVRNHLGSTILAQAILAQTISAQTFLAQSMLDFGSIMLAQTVLAQACWLKNIGWNHLGSNPFQTTVAQTALAQLFRFKPSRLKQCWLKPFWLRLVRLLPPTILAQMMCTWGAYVLLGGPHAFACTTLSPPPTNMYDMYIRKCKQLSRFSIAPPCKSPGKSVCTLENSCNMHFIEFAHKGLQSWTSSAQIQMCFCN